jgi:hypothetical protein
MTGARLSEHSSATYEARTLGCAHRISLAHAKIASFTQPASRMDARRSTALRPISHAQPQQHRHGKPMTEQPKNRFTQKSLRLSGFDRHFDVLALVSTAAKAQVDALAFRADRAGLRVRSQCRLCVSKNGSTNFHSEATARSHSRILHPPRLWMGGLTDNPMGLFGHRPPLVCRVSSATLHVCGVRVRHCNHHKGVSRNARSSGRYKNILCAPRLTMSFLHQTINKSSKPNIHLPNNFPTSSLSASIQSPQTQTSQIQWPPQCTDHPSPAPSTPPMLPSPRGNPPPAAPEQSTHATPRATPTSLTLNLSPQRNRKLSLAAPPSPEPSTLKTHGALP